MVGILCLSSIDLKLDLKLPLNGSDSKNLTV